LSAKGAASDRTSGGVANGMSWGHPKKGRLLKVLLGLAIVLVGTAPASAADGPSAGRTTSVIVRELPGAGDAPERAVARMGGHVGDHIGIIDGFVAEVPLSRLAVLRSVTGVHSVTLDGKVQLLDHDDDDDDDDGDDGGGGRSSSRSLAPYATKAWTFWQRGYTGQGVDVALIDSGVVPVDGLTVPGKVINGADLSFESQAENLRYLDTFGHGTHMAGIIAGYDEGARLGKKRRGDEFVGMAPGARLLSVKVADAGGATDVSQVIAAIDWVVQHRSDNGMNIRVLNLSFGTDGTQSYLLDPLTHAAEMAWRRGIVVVVAAGNETYGSTKLNNPAYDPYVLAVGGADHGGNDDYDDDEVGDFSSCGNPSRRPDLLAPGKSILSLRSPGSHIDQTYPGARLGTRFFKGTGTSQAAAVVSGAAALLIDQRPSITADQVKALLMQTAKPLRDEDERCQGEGMLNLKSALKASTPFAVQTWAVSTGLGLLEAARGSAHVVDDGVALTGEKDIFGTAWDSKSWSQASWTGVSWLGGLFNSKSWSGDSWSGDSWAGKSWSSASWSATSWAGREWSDPSWTSKSWSSKSWSTGPWTSKSWSSKSWSSKSWSTVEWGD
jgi:subtilisin family serine protease